MLKKIKHSLPDILGWVFGAIIYITLLIVFFLTLFGVIEVPVYDTLLL